MFDFGDYYVMFIARIAKYVLKSAIKHRFSPKIKVNYIFYKMAAVFDLCSKYTSEYENSF